MIETLVLVAFLVVWTGPACEDVRARRQMKREQPKARIVPILACQKCGRVKCPWHL